MNNPSVVPLAEPLPAVRQDFIRIFLRDCTVELNVGIHAHEKTGPQKIIVNIEAEAALPHRYQDLNENSLDRVINYEKFHAYLTQELPQRGHIPLLETVAEQIVTFVFADPRIHAVRVRLEKPGIFASTAGAGIEVYRARQHQSAG